MKIFYKIYQVFYPLFLKITKRGSFVVKGKFTSCGFFRIEIAKNAKLVILL